MELAHGGTFFLDEVQLASAQLQGILLRLLERSCIRRLGDEGLGITSSKQFGDLVDNIVANATGSDVRKLSRGRTAYWDGETGTVVIHDPKSKDGGTAFRPKDGREYFEGLK